MCVCVCVCVALEQTQLNRNAVDVLSGKEAPQSTASASFGRAVRVLLRHLVVLLTSEPDERDAIVVSRLLGELNEFNETHALIPRLGFVAALDDLPDQTILTHYQRWKTKNSNQWSVLGVSFFCVLIKCFSLLLYKNPTNLLKND